MKDIDKKIRESKPELPTENHQLGQTIYNRYSSRNRKPAKFKLFLKLVPVITSIVLIIGITAMLNQNKGNRMVNGSNSSSSNSQVGGVHSDGSTQNPGTESNNPLIAELPQNPYQKYQGGQLYIGFYQLLDQPELNLGAYEVLFDNDLETDYFLVAYCPLSLANEIYLEYQEVDDAIPASPLDIVDGTIVDWLRNRNQLSALKWFEFQDSSKIISQFDDYVAVGVYQISKVIIIREVISDQEMNKTMTYFNPLGYANNQTAYLSQIEQPLEGRFVIITEQEKLNNVISYNEIVINGKYCKINDDRIKLWYQDAEAIIARFPEYQMAIVDRELTFIDFDYQMFLELTRTIQGSS